jgi:quercetin dioxygenase-like cupin family protein/ketosteroid isomerase-like protein
MQTAKQTERAITGEEELGDLTHPIQALAQFYRAFNRRDLSLMEQNWDNSNDIAMDNPLGGIKRGWREIQLVYERIFNSEPRVNVEFFDYSLQTLGETFLAVGRERGRLTSKKKALDLVIRTTRVFRRVDSGHWKQIHHHGSFEDPPLLAEYQNALKAPVSSARGQGSKGVDQSDIVRTLLLTAFLGSRNITSVDVRQIIFAPGQQSGCHKHPCPVVGFIVDGSALLQVEGQIPIEVPAGSAFYEPADTVISRFGNLSSVAPLRFVACYLLHGQQDLIEMLPNQQ